MICPRCSNANTADQRFCGQCGAPLTETAAGYDTLDRIGQVLEGKYRLERMLGMGAAGAVYRAQIEGLGQPVAVKVLHPEISADNQARRRLENESRLASMIEHPNIVSILDFHSSAELTYLVMEYLSGVSLDEVVAEVGFLGVRRSIHIVRQVLSALEASHHNGVLHRDLKPDNIFLSLRHDRLDFVKVVDFGLATLKERPAESRITVEGYVCGTPAYMAPEQVRNIDLSERSDLYSVGVLLYECLTGINPFIGATTVDTLVNQVTLNPRPPSRACKAAKIPLYLDALVMRALSKDASKRFATAQEFRVVLEGLALAQTSGRAAVGTTCGECGTALAPGTPRCTACGHRIEPLPELAQSAVENVLTPELIGALDREDSQELELSPTTTTTTYRAVVWDPPLVGRTLQLVRITDAPQTGPGPYRPRFLRIIGAPGLGKGRVVREAARRVTDGGWTVVWIGHELQPVASSLTPVQQAVERLLQLTQPVEETTLWEAARQAGLASDHRRGLLELFGLAPRSSDPPEQQRARRLRAWCAVVQAAVERGPLQLIFQDLHLMDPPSQQLVAALVTRATFAHPFEVLVTHDPSLNMLWGETETVTVPALTSAQAAELAGQLLQYVGLEQERRDELVPLSGGNPMMLIELVRLLALDPSIRPPHSLVQVINERVSRLPSAARAALHAMAVLGRAADEGTVARVLQAARADQQQALRFLGEQGFLAQDEQGWRLSHRLHWEVAYNAVPAARRQQLHASVAELTLSEGGPAAVVAHHLVCAGLHERAVPYLLRAGRRALYFLDHRLASQLFGLVLRVSPLPPAKLQGESGPWLRATIGLADAMADAGDASEALRVLRQAVSRAGAAGWLEEQQVLVDALARVRRRVRADASQS